jgi:serine/threonine protein phosphatase 1
MKTFVISDIHGAHRALRQVIERSGFDHENDRLICLGDTADGWPEVRQCLAELRAVRSLVYILGNHDEWMLRWVETGLTPGIWMHQGGEATLTSYGGSVDNVAYEDYLLLRDARLWYEDHENRRMFVHGGWNWPGHEHPNLSSRQEVIWDRTLINSAMSYPEGPRTAFREVYVGHTQTVVNNAGPQQFREVWAMDQGAGWTGRLSMMDVESKEWWQSDPVTTLYADVLNTRSARLPGAEHA